MPRRVPLDKLRALNQRHSKREIARILGVHERTVRRWIAGVVAKPKKLSAFPIAEKLQRQYTRDRQAATREFKRQHIPKLGVEVPPPSRRITYKGEIKPSPTVESDIEHSLSSDLFVMLKNYRNRQNLKGETAMVRFLGYGSADSNYPGQWFWSDWEIVNDYTDEEIDEFLESTSLQFEEITKMRFDV